MREGARFCICVHQPGTASACSAQVSCTGQVLVVLGVWVVILVLSPFWLRRFAFGPVEWLWRSLTYGARPPFRLVGPMPSPPAAAPSV